MNAKLTFFMGIIGAGLFAIPAIVGGLLIPDYSIIGQFISESYASGTEYGFTLRAFGYIPSGLFLTGFCLLAIRHFPKSNLIKIGFYGFALFYGLTTVVTGLFPCDIGCNRAGNDPSTSQMIHDLAGILTYLFAPFCILLIGLGFKKVKERKLALHAIICVLLSYCFIFLMSDVDNEAFIGLYQRLVESAFMYWIVICAIAIRDNHKQVTTG